ncbi:MAG: complex I NDUFA9 subunit family protein [Alphaproteobacteria bacterium]
MSHQNPTATIFGGTGFVGRQIVRELASRGFTVKIATRAPESAYFLKPCGTVGQIVPLAVNYADPESIARALSNTDIAVNCIGILYEKRRGAFNRVHTELAGRIAQACRDQGVRRLVHISALGVDQAHSRYARTKLAGEQAVLDAFPTATILRPGVIFGPDDHFFNKFAELSRYLPALPLIGGGKTRLQPVYVGDVADAAIAAIEKPTKDVQGHIFELGGPDIVTFRDVYEKMFAATGRRRRLVSLPFALAKIDAFFLGLIPGEPLLTCDQVETLKTDSIVTEGRPGLAELGVTPHGMDAVLPIYLERFCEGGHHESLSEKPA